MVLYRIRQSTELQLSVRQNLQSLLDNYSNPTIKRIQVKIGDKYRLIKLDEILFFKADEKYVEIHTMDQKYLITDSLTTLTEQLPDDFVRVHRSAIINLNHMDEIIRLSSNVFEVRMKNSDKTRLPLSRKYKKSLNL